MTTIQDEQQYFTPKELNKANKDINVKRIIGLDIFKFRNMIDKQIHLSNRITLISGHNGTMKSTLIGLFVQSFNSDYQDLFGGDLKTKFGQIFKLSSKYDKERYDYNLIIEDEEDKQIAIPVYTKPRSSSDPRLRIVTGGNSGTDGNLIFATNYLNLNRLISISSTNAQPCEITLTPEEKEFVSKFYYTVLQKDSYQSVQSISDNKQKKTFAPDNSNYDYESISSGEDNLGRVANSLISFMRIKKENKEKKHFNGILCIDEIEASLHPVAQKNLFEFLYKWSEQNKVQILITTHSLPLIEYGIESAAAGKEIKTYYLSSLYSENIEVIEDPNYQNIYQELTFDYNFDLRPQLPKIDILCEDELAKKFIRLMVSSKNILNRINFITFDDTEGFPYKFLIKLCNTASSFVKDTIIIFDSDVEKAAMDKIKKQSNILQLPDYNENLPIEKLFVKYLFEKQKNDPIYTDVLKMPRAVLIQTLTDARLYLKAETNWKEIDVKPFKYWFKRNSSIVTKTFNSFAKSVKGREEFVNSLVEKLNAINKNNGYPEIKID